MTSIERIPIFCFGIASRAVVAFADARDITVLSLSAIPVLTAAVAALLLVLFGLELMVRALPTRPWFGADLRVPAALSIIGMPLIHGIPVYWSNRTLLPNWGLGARPLRRSSEPR